MTPNKLELIAGFLEAYSDVLANKSCNDHALPHTPENEQIMRDCEQFYSKNLDNWHQLEIENGVIYTLDVTLVGYLAHLCKEEAQNLRAAPDGL